MKQRINNGRFTVRICHVANLYGFTTIGSMYRALKKAQPHARWGGFSGNYLINEIERELKLTNNKKACIHATNQL